MITRDKEYFRLLKQKSRKSNNFTVYKITDCNGLFYIGCTKQKLRDRITNHRSASNATNSRLLDWSNDVIVEEVAVCYDGETAFTIESALIQRYAEDENCVNFRR